MTRRGRHPRAAARARRRAFPIGAKGPAKVVADVTLQPDGTVAEAAIREGDSRMRRPCCRPLRTWRFASEAEAPPVAFQVRAEFVPWSAVAGRAEAVGPPHRGATAGPCATPEAMQVPATVPATPAPRRPCLSNRAGQPGSGDSRSAVPALATPAPAAPATPAPPAQATPQPPVLNPPVRHPRARTGAAVSRRAHATARRSDPGGPAPGALPAPGNARRTWRARHPASPAPREPGVSAVATSRSAGPCLT